MMVNLVCYKGTQDIFDRLIRIMRGKSVPYTHVGLCLTDPSDDSITYMASREDGGVNTYTVPLTEVDLYPLPAKSEDYILRYFDKTKGTSGSLITDCGYRNLKDFDAIGTTEWVAQALDLGFPEKYTIQDLINYSELLKTYGY